MATSMANTSTTSTTSGHLLQVHELFQSQLHHEPPTNCSGATPSAILLSDQLSKTCEPKDCNPTSGPSSRVRCVESDDKDEHAALEAFQAAQMLAESQFVLLEVFDQATGANCAHAPNQIAMVFATHGECIRSDTTEPDSAMRLWQKDGTIVNDKSFGSWCLKLSSDGDSVTLILFSDSNCLWAIQTTTALFTECAQNQMRFQKRSLLVPDALTEIPTWTSATKSSASSSSKSGGRLDTSKPSRDNLRYRNGSDLRINTTKVSVLVYYALTLSGILALGILAVKWQRYQQRHRQQPIDHYHEFQPGLLLEQQSAVQHSSQIQSSTASGTNLTKQPTSASQFHTPCRQN